MATDVQVINQYFTCLRILWLRMAFWMIPIAYTISMRLVLKWCAVKSQEVSTCMDYQLRDGLWSIFYLMFRLHVPYCCFLTVIHLTFVQSYQNGVWISNQCLRSSPTHHTPYSAIGKSAFGSLKECCKQVCHKFLIGNPVEVLKMSLMVIAWDHASESRLQASYLVYYPFDRCARESSHEKFISFSPSQYNKAVA